LSARIEDTVLSEDDPSERKKGDFFMACMAVGIRMRQLEEQATKKEEEK